MMLTSLQWFSLILDSVDFPFALPVGDLSTVVRGRSERKRMQDSGSESV